MEMEGASSMCDGKPLKEILMGVKESHGKR